MPLTDTAIKAAKPKEKPYKLSDSGGMYLEVAPSGGKWWRLKYRIDGKEKRISLGTYPEIGLKEARERREAARRLLAHGVDPSAHRQATRAASEALRENTFEALAREWYGVKAGKWADTYRDKILSRLERFIFPPLGARPLTEITASELLAVLREIEAQGKGETAHRTRSYCVQIFQYAIATGKADRNPARDLTGTLKPRSTTHRAAVTDPKKVAGLLRAIDDYSGTTVVECALRLAPLVFVRPGELRRAEWAEIDLEAAQWNIPAEKMKTRAPHIVPLSTQAIAILESLRPLTGNGRFVFPSERSRDRPMSDNAVLAALRRMGFPKEEMSGHGFRAMARTILDEVLGEPPHLIDHQLAHAVKDANGRAYNRTTHLPERRRMMQRWADYLDSIKTGAEIYPLRKPA